ncbi:SusC/RagA family TonB-linked outer membrane protein [Fulvivirga lutimaris]|uniref:SusC/RagA family TonB-linked outer membrane protein n=1 Tax=Fulvivirga lutimaris TaxID=1819566 RepID=UPI0012BBB2F5|nr:SusC/RagA family TonB-linked outer membrane protein [Fulvivirga lutimaris]MTI41642.1 SusC/RagA family TonB-linked outer membrane protein [Fulvivirga lutimaris]
MKKFLLLSFMLMFAFTVSESWAQERTVSGKVTSIEDGSTLPGVNVVLKGTTTGTVTDIDGNFQLSIPSEGGILVFSFIGLATEEISAGSRSVIDVQMSPDVKQLSEVVVTALGIERESRAIGYGIDVVDAEELTKARETNIVNSLQGKVTGVTISNTGGNLGASSKIIVRGVTSLSGRNNPIWIVDGIFINDAQTNTTSRISGNRDFSNGAAIVNPDDIATISVLKGAAATALYGSRAAAGAIVVTTKRGKASKGGGATVVVNSTVRMDDLFKIPDYQQGYAMGSGAKYDSSSLGFDWGPKIVGQNVDALPITGQPGALTAQDDNSIRDFFRTGVSYINNVSIGDADERMDYRLSLTSLNQTGILPNAELDRLNIGLNAGVKHNDKLKTRFGVQYARTTSQGTGVTGANDPNIIGLGSFSSTANYNNFKPWIDESGNQINQLTPTSNNPFWIQNENKNERQDDRFIGNFEMVYSPLEKLDLIARVGYDFEVDDRLISNRKGTAQRVDGTYIIDKIQRNELTTDMIANYQTDLSSDFSLNVLGGFQFNRRIFERESINGTSLLIPELFAPGNTEQVVASRGFSEQKLFGLYGQAELGYKNWATLTVTARNDWSSTLPLDNNSFFYPSISGAFVFTDAFNIANNVLSFGKLRASYAQVGNDTNPYQLNFNFNPISTATGQYSLNANFPFDGRLAFAKDNTIPPAALQPEQQTSYEFGTELQFFDGKVGLDVSYFKSQNKNQILALPIPESTGFAARLTNVGQVDTEGIEISLSATPLEIGDFTWNTIVNFTHTESTVVELADDLERTLIASAFNSVQVVAVPGKEFQLYAIPFARDSASGRPLIDPNTGRRIAGEAKTFGSVLPDFTMGFVNNFSYKGITLSATVDWRSGGIMKSSTVEGLQTGGLTEETLQNREGTFIDATGVIANPDGTIRENDVPLRNAQDFWTSINDNSVAEPFIYDASFVKLREISISYSFPTAMLSNSFINGLQVGVEGRNLALLYSKVPHIDPESNLFGSGADGFGVERASVPSTRSLGFNVRLTF